MLRGVPSSFFEVVGATTVLFVSFFGVLYLIDSYNSISIQEKARWGIDVIITFDPNPCDEKILGGLRCDFPYLGKYSRGTNTWVVTGRPRQSNQVMTNSYSNAPNEPGHISIWGAQGQFDQSGRLKIGGREVGLLEIDRVDAVLHFLGGFIFSSR